MKAVIPAAGKGERMGYLSKILPKCLFPVYDKPILQHIFDKLTPLGIKKFYLITNYQEEKIKEYCESLSLNIEFIHQSELKGIAHAISLCEDLISKPFITVLGDDLTVGDLKPLIRLFHRKKAVVVEGVVKEPNLEILRQTNCMELRSTRIIKIEEKPKKPFANLRGIGV